MGTHKINKMAKVLVLGSTGMLGSQVMKTLKEKGHTVKGTIRPYSSQQPLATAIKSQHSDRTEGLVTFDAYHDREMALIPMLDWADYVINCIGIIKPFMNKYMAASIKVNSIFPRMMAQMIEKFDGKTKFIHITTDCVYSGQQPTASVESTPHDALDEYGKSKSLGEPVDTCMVLRTSIIGEEMDKHASLISWVKSQKGEEIDGYSHHLWNGVTTAQYADVIHQIMEKELFEIGLFHVHSNTVNKFQLMNMLNERFDLSLKINEVEGFPVVNRALATEKGLMDKLEILPLSEQIKAI